MPQALHLGNADLQRLRGVEHLDPIRHASSVASYSDDIFAELCCRLIRGRLIASREHDTRAFFRKRERGRQTDPTIAARDEHILAFESFHTVIPLVTVNDKLTYRGRCESLMSHSTNIAGPVRCSA